MAVNQRVARKLEELGREAAGFRKAAYFNGAKWLKKVDRPVLSAKQAIRFPGIGKSLSEKIGIYADEAWASLSAADIRSEGDASQLAQVWGVGPAVLKKWTDMGVTTLEQAASLPGLTSMQRAGLTWFHHLSQRIPRDEVKEYLIRIQTSFRKSGNPWLAGIQVIGTGSFRRGKAMVGDMDLLLVLPRPVPEVFRMELECLSYLVLRTESLLLLPQQA